MNWNTIYITGKAGFEKEVLNLLEHSRIKFMPGTMSEIENFSLIWIEENTAFRSVKKAIGWKTILKYRLHFFCSLEAVNISNTEETSTQKEIIHKMNEWEEEDSPRYKNSA